MPGNLTLPTPNAYRSPFRHADGTYDWASELDYGFAIVDAQSSGQPGGLSSSSRSCPPVASSTRLPVTSPALKGILRRTRAC